MKASVILAHPYEKSFNHAIFYTAVDCLKKAGVLVFAHDLYAEGFDPVMTVDELGKDPTEDPLVAQYARELTDSDLLVFVHPNWWGQPPAILKGYIDRVIRPPYAYDFDENAQGAPATGKLTGKTGIVFNTSNTPEERENNYFHDPLEYLWGRCVFGFCGMEEGFTRRMFRVVADSTEEIREGWLEEVGLIIERVLEGS
ncbi:MAG: NAD(P)H-dependent oxidoreductase [Spirochaetales bacterium]|nr:NAD(P)H-dependent oxidoreductase [Spirochaetales bacterium]